jgi:probable rRNA maturation factor
VETSNINIKNIEYEILAFNSSSTKFLPIKKVVEAVERVFVGEKNQGSQKNESGIKTNVIYLDDDEIHKINKEFLTHDYPTDVITFTIEESPLEGEIYIGVGVAKVQAEEYAVSLQNECLRLAVHGALHLCGYEDDTGEKRRAMHLLENKYMGL